MVKVLFVCLGNICRSPTAEGVFRKLLASEKIEPLVLVDSAGTHAYHVGEPPDRRAQEAALRRGINLSNLKGRRAEHSDIEEFDYVLAMDSENYHNLMDIAGDQGHKVRLLMEYSSNYEACDVPDPYFGGVNGFEKVLDMIEDAAVGLLQDIRRAHSI